MSDWENNLRRAREGDLEAFAALVRQFEEKAVRWAFSSLRDWELAQDAAQEAFLQAHRDLGALREPKAFPGWLRRLVAKHCDRLVRKKRVPVQPLESVGEIPSSADNPRTIAERREMSKLVLEAIRRLPAHEREVVALHYLEERPHKEIAALLEIPQTTVNSRLSASRRRLRGYLEPLLAEPATAGRPRPRRHWLPSNLYRKGRKMRLRHEKAERPLLKGGAEILIRIMTREDIPAMRHYDDTFDFDGTNLHNAPGSETSPGGPWADDDELRDHFEKYAKAGNITLLAEGDGGKIIGFVDLWRADEPAPFGLSLNAECIDYVHEYYHLGIETLLLEEAEKVARAAGLQALDVGSNTASGDYPPLRRFGMQVFYEYDDVLCGCRPDATPAGPKWTSRMVGPRDANLAGLLRISHWCATDFTFRDESGSPWIAEIVWGNHRALLELWRDDDKPVPEHKPDRSELYATPEVLESPELMSDLFVACTQLAAEAGAEQVAFACPSPIELDAGRVDVIERAFRFAWFRKAWGPGK
ncbi:sigma-70 family RNA polymerase sigma factor [Candidatus Sumerlaeota bacterium]